MPCGLHESEVHTGLFGVLAGDEKCNPPLKGPEDLIGMQLRFNFSIGAGRPKWKAITFNRDEEELYERLFVGGVEFIKPLQGHGVESAMDLLFEVSTLRKKFLK